MVNKGLSNHFQVSDAGRKLFLDGFIVQVIYMTTTHLFWPLVLSDPLLLSFR